MQSGATFIVSSLLLCMLVTHLCQRLCSSGSPLRRHVLPPAGPGAARHAAKAQQRRPPQLPLLFDARRGMLPPVVPRPVGA